MPAERPWGHILLSILCWYAIKAVEGRKGGGTVFWWTGSHHCARIGVHKSYSLLSFVVSFQGPLHLRIQALFSECMQELVIIYIC